MKSLSKKSTSQNAPCTTPSQVSEGPLREQESASDKLPDSHGQPLKAGESIEQGQDGMAAVARWTRLMAIYLDVLERNEYGMHIETLGNDMGLGNSQTDNSSGWILRTAIRLDATKAVALYHQVNPDIDLESLTNLSHEDEYNVAIGMLRLFAEQEPEEEDSPKNAEATALNTSERPSNEEFARLILDELLLETSAGERAFLGDEMSHRSNGLGRAIILATTSHGIKNQRDKGDAPYILHPLRVMLKMTTESEMMAAVLHDVVEDTSCTLADLRRASIPEEVVRAVDCLTKREGESYDSFIQRVKSDSISRRVKLADLADNMDITRLQQLSEQDTRRLNKYLRAGES